MVITISIAGTALIGNCAIQLSDTSVIQHSNAENESESSILSAISGSQWPGVIDHLLQRPLAENDNAANIHINYPSTGNKFIDTDIRNWVSSLADAFEEHLNIPKFSENEISFEIDQFLQDDDLHSQMALKDDPGQQRLELWGNYQISRPSDNAVSITFELWNYTSQDQGNLDVLTLNYNLLNGQRLNLVDMFDNPELALHLMSAWSRKNLVPRLGAAGRAQMLNDGTEPLLENYSSLTLTKDGICINFQPWQVAPWNAGVQKVEMPLAELMEAGPLLVLWDKQI